MWQVRQFSPKQLTGALTIKLSYRADTTILQEKKVISLFVQIVVYAFFKIILIFYVRAKN